MNAAVTGGTGFFGRALLHLLVPEADTVRVLVRRAEDEAEMRALGTVPIRGDLTAADGCAGLVEPGDVVFHAAARVDLTGSWSDFERTTVGGTRRLLEAALPQKPARFVYVSSAGVYSPEQACRPEGVSAQRFDPQPPKNNFYGRAKLAAENLVRSECQRAGCSWAIMRLGFLYGPGNRALLKHFVPMLERGLLRIIGNGRNRIATLYVDDAARAALLAGTHPSAADKIYDIASEEPVTQQEYLQATAEALGLPRPEKHVPRGVALIFAGLSELWARITGGTPSFTRPMITLMSADQVVDAGRIRDDLGWQPETAFAEGIRRMQT